MFKLFLKKKFTFFFHQISCFTVFLIFWTFLAWGKNPYNWSYRKLIFVSSCIHDILGWKFPWLIMDIRLRFNICIKKKYNKKSKCIEKYFAFTFLVSDTQLYADDTLYFDNFFRKLEYLSYDQSFRVLNTCPAA